MIGITRAKCMSKRRRITFASSAMPEPTQHLSSSFWAKTQIKKLQFSLIFCTLVDSLVCNISWDNSYWKNISHVFKTHHALPPRANLWQPRPNIHTNEYCIGFPGRANIPCPQMHIITSSHIPEGRL